MEIDRELVVLVLGWGATIILWMLLAFVIMSLFDNEDPGNALLYNRNKLLTSEGLFVVALYLSLAWFFSFGFTSMFWMIPEIPETEEGASRSGAALTFGVFASAVMFKIAERINRLHWARVGKDEIVADVTTLLPALLYKNADADQKIDKLIEEIEADFKRKRSPVVEIAAQRRVEFLKRLKAMV